VACPWRTISCDTLRLPRLYIPQSGWKSARPEFYYVHIISCIHTACRKAATKLSVLSLVLRTVRSAGRLAGKQNWFPFERVDREERKIKKENLFLFQLSIWKLDTRCTLFLLSITIAKRRRRWRRHFFTVDGRHTRCCCRKSLETTLEDGRALFRPIWDSCISAIPEKLYRENSVDHGDPAAFFQPKRSASLEGMCWLTALDINT